MGDTESDASETDAPAAPPAPTASEPANDRLPDDHPLVKAYKAEKAKAAEARQKLSTYDQAEQTEGEKFAAAVKRAEEAEIRALRLEVAAEKGLTPAQAKRLVGASKDELEADADEIIEAFPAKAPMVPPSSKPSPSGRGGTDPTEPVDTIDIAKLANAIPRP
jgi:hypothetical protein